MIAAYKFKYQNSKHETSSNEQNPKIHNDEFVKAPLSSLPRRRESRKAVKDWIPASAGMTMLSRVGEGFIPSRGWV
jgi:hypothetical protein